GVRRPTGPAGHRPHHRARHLRGLAGRPRRAVPRARAAGRSARRMTLQLRDELVATARRMSELGLAPGTTGNVSVRTARGFVVTPSGMAYDQLRGDDAVAIDLDG